MHVTRGLFFLALGGSLNDGRGQRPRVIEDFVSVSQMGHASILNKLLVNNLLSKYDG